MAIIKCKMCGGDLNIVEASTVAECEYCGTKQTVPTADNEKKLTLFGRAGRLLRACEFDKAAGVFEGIVADYPEEAEAYWGLVLCKYGIEYVDDPATGKKIPTCHRSSFESVLDDENFAQACENADPVARRLYREEAKAIEELRRGIIEVSGKEAPYDIFICYKETDEHGDRTLDSVLAQDIYDALTEQGYRVFFSRVTLEDKLGQEYEPYIFAALNSAKVMLAVGTDYDYYNAVWVKNEWSRFLHLIASGQKKTLIPCYKNLDAYDMPKEFAKLQAQDLGKVGAMQDLLRGVDKLLGKAQSIVENVTPVQVPNGPSVVSLCERGNLFLEDAEWGKADEYFDKALDIDPKCARAYLGKLLASQRAKNTEDLKNQSSNVISNPLYQKALRFAQGAFLDEMNMLDENLQRIESERKNNIRVALRKSAEEIVRHIQTESQKEREKNERQIKRDLDKSQKESERLDSEERDLKKELASLKGMFSGIRKKAIETRLTQIHEEQSKQRKLQFSLSKRQEYLSQQEQRSEEEWVEEIVESMLTTKSSDQAMLSGTMGAATESVRAPMPGTILEVCATPGQHVRMGEDLFIMEAMKMENEIYAPVNAVVVDIYVEKGQSVNTGETLATILPITM